MSAIANVAANSSTTFLNWVTTTNEILERVNQININVSEYGAVGDGSTDDTTALQNALDAAFTAGGGKVFLFPGNFKITSTLTMGNNVVIDSMNPFGNTKITSTAASGAMIKNSPDNTAEPTINIGIKNVKIEGNSNLDNAIKLEGVKNSFFENLHISGFSKSGSAALELTSHLDTSVSKYRSSRYNKFRNIEIDNVSTGVLLDRNASDTTVHGGDQNLFESVLVSNYSVRGFYNRNGLGNLFLHCKTDATNASTEGLNVNGSFITIEAFVDNSNVVVANNIIQKANSSTGVVEVNDNWTTTFKENSLIKLSGTGTQNNDDTYRVTNVTFNGSSSRTEITVTPSLTGSHTTGTSNTTSGNGVVELRQNEFGFLNGGKGPNGLKGIVIGSAANNVVITNPKGNGSEHKLFFDTSANVNSAIVLMGDTFFVGKMKGPVDIESVDANRAGLTLNQRFALNGPTLNLRNSLSANGAGGTLKFTGVDSSGNDFEQASLTVDTANNQNTGESATWAFKSILDGSTRTWLQLNANAATRVLEINPDGIDVDIRIEGDTDSDLLYVNAGTDRVGVGTNAPTEKLHVDGNVLANENVLATKNIKATANVVAASHLTALNATFTGNVAISGGSSLTISVDASVGGDFTVSGNLVIDTDGLFVDALTERVGINKIPNEATLDVESTDDIVVFKAVSTDTTSRTTLPVRSKIGRDHSLSAGDHVGGSDFVGANTVYGRLEVVANTVTASSERSTILIKGLTDGTLEDRVEINDDHTKIKNDLHVDGTIKSDGQPLPLTTEFESTAITMATGNQSYSAAHGLGTRPKMYFATANNVTTDPLTGHKPGDEIIINFGVISGGGNVFSTWNLGANNTHIYASQFGTPVITDKDGGNDNSMTPANWELFLKGWV